MENLIKNNLDQAAYLENLYRSNPADFKRTFLAVYPEIQTELPAQIWHERLRNAQEEITWGGLKDWIFVGVIALLVAFFMQLPDIFSISHDVYFPRNLAFIVMPGIAAYLAFKQGLPFKSLIAPLGILLFSMVFINFCLSVRQVIP